MWSPHCVNSECLPRRGVLRFGPPTVSWNVGLGRGAEQDTPNSLARHIHSCISGKSRAPDLHTRSFTRLLALKCLITPTSHPPTPTESWPLPPSRVLGPLLCMPEVAPNLQPKHVCV